MDSSDKTCTCCKKIYTAAEWAALPVLPGPPMEYEDDNGRWWSLELKNCDCNGTMAVPTEIPAPAEAA